MTGTENAPLARRRAGGGVDAESAKESTSSGRLGEPSTPSAEIVSPRPGVENQLQGVIARKSKKRRRFDIFPGSAEALEMLTLAPVFATHLPRYHVEPRAPDGSRLVHDRATRETIVVYTPRFADQFRGGHQAGLWYVRAKSDLRTAPNSSGFASASAAVEALKTGQWGHSRSVQNHGHAARQIHIIWN
jgi:hypothetical protein